jgi:TetR/AcrR family fatty acid metabolism transcriptional regulator
MEDIAAMAGVGKGTIYEYFRSKDDIFREAHKQFHKEIDKMVEEIIERDCSPDEKLRMIVKESLNLFQKRNSGTSIISAKELTGIIMQFWSEGVREDSDKLIDPMRLKNIYRKYRKILSDILDDGIKQGIFRKTDTRLSASVIVAILDGIPLQRIIEPRVFSGGKISEVIFENIMTGIKA